MITNTLIINGTDFSSIVQKYGLTDTLREVNGPNAGKSINGEDIYDIIARKTDITVNCKPLSPEQYATLCGIQMTNPVTVQYFSYTYNTLKTITGRLTISTPKLAMNTADRTLYEGINLLIVQK